MQFPKTIRLPHEAYSNTDAVFHVVVSALPGMTPFEDTALGDVVWAVVLGEESRTAVKVSAACLMPDHLHVLVSPRDKSIIRWMNDFKSLTTQISKGFRPQRFLWHPSFYDRRLRDVAEFESAMGYVLKNPSIAGLVDSDEDWPWVGSWVD